MSEETQIPSKKVWIIIAAVGMFAFMSTLDSSIVNIALPIMSKQLSIPMNQATWVVSIYLIIISGLLTFFGRLGDQIGKIRVFRFGTYIFTVGSLIAGINLGLWFLLFARTIQAIGAAMTMSNSFGIVTTIAPPSQRARGMALNSSFVSLGTIAGPGLGGIILQHFSWSYIFWINVPVGIIAIIIGRLVFPKSAEIDHDALKFDYVGISTLFLFITTFFLAINIGQEQGFLSSIPVTLTVFALIVFVIFIVHELHAEM
ncbi:MAG: MFS transporter, partial [Paucilactobacillus nenjiangensis]